jgi:hypothetical protein
VGRKELEALIAVLQSQLELGRDGAVLGTWHIHFDGKRGALLFDKCEAEGYCQERPSVVAVDGTVLDPGGPLFDDDL